MVTFNPLLNIRDILVALVFPSLWNDEPSDAQIDASRASFPAAAVAKVAVALRLTFSSSPDHPMVSANR